MKYKYLFEPKPFRWERPTLIIYEQSLYLAKQQAISILNQDKFLEDASGIKRPEWLGNDYFITVVYDLDGINS